MTSAHLVPVSPTERLQDELVDEIVGHLEEGGLLGYPTETVYGFGGLADAGPLERLGRLKGDADRKGYVMLIESVDAARELAWTPAARALAQAFWPGPLTLVLADPEGRFPIPARSADDTVAVRVSPHPVPAVILPALGQPLTSSSANLIGERPARSGAEVLDVARRWGDGIDLLVLDYGVLPEAPPSTIVDASTERPRILRAGALSSATILQVVADA